MKTLGKRAIVCFSGGLDSYIMLRKALAECEDVAAIYVDYGSKHSKQESIVSVELCRELDVLIRRVEVSSYLFESNLVNGELPLGRSFEEIAADEVNPAYVPNRNMLIASIGGSYAITKFGLKPSVVCMGFHHTDGGAFVDTTVEASRAIDSCLRGCTSGNVGFFSFAEYEKHELLRYAVDTLRVHPRELWRTRSCYLGSDSSHCGICDACVVRKQAFERAGIPDETVYKE